MSDITIEGPEVERADGTVRCIGFGVDTDGRVTGRFALPKGHDWDAPAGTESVEFVESMDDLPDIHSDYRLQE